MTRAALLAALDARARRVDALRDTVTCADALALLRSLPAACVDAVVTDPPYNMRKADWDTFESDQQFVRWLGQHVREFRRVLKPNGSLYLFTRTDLQAFVEIEVRKYFNVLNNIRWRKPPYSTKAEMFDKDTMRRYFPASETIIFADQYGSDSPFNDAMIDGDGTYWQKCESAKRGIFGDYLLTEFARAGVERRDIAALFPSRTGNLTGCVSNWLLGYNIPTPEQYQAMRDYLNTHHKNGHGEYLRREYEDLRREYEDLRRPFNVSETVPYTDTWDFATVQAYEGKHPAEKPLALMQHIIAASTRPGALVLDPFCGSGTTLDAARQLDRHYIGGDMDAHWCRVARARLARPWQLPLALGA
jgi:site-specific DNA-methyltransferase (adenine-specific)